MYQLTVVNGGGDGYYGVDQTIAIYADAAPEGYAFERWVGQTWTVSDVNSAATTLMSEDMNLTVTATYVTVGTPTPTPTPTLTPTPTPTPDPDLPSSARHYFFGHSLVNFSSDDQNVPHWIGLFLAEGGADYAADGEFRYSDYNIPARADWWFESVPSAWQSNFAETDYTAVVYTDLNYVQYQAPTEPYCCDSDADHTPVNSVLRAYDHVNANEPGVRFYIYENWPEFRNWPPSQAQFQSFHQLALGETHDWWLSLLAEVGYQRSNVKMIPVGPVISKLLSVMPALQNISADELYVDDAPHGTATIYFLAAMVQYSAIFEQPAPSSFVPSGAIHPLVRENYNAIAAFIWDDLHTYEDRNGDSIVF